MRGIIGTLLLISICVTPLFAQYTEDLYFPTDSIETKNLRFVGLPLAFFTPETNFGFGGGGQIFLLKK